MLVKLADKGFYSAWHKVNFALIACKCYYPMYFTLKAYGATLKG